MNHSFHDYGELLRRWRNLAAVTDGAVLSEIAIVNDEPVLSIETGPQSDATLYISAGVHGDECAPVWALLHWAEANRSILQSGSFQLFPCLNPGGLIENTRIDRNGVDLNRGFQNREIPVIAAWQNKIGSRRFSRALNLHEDYDSLGIYLYEIAESPLLGRVVLDHASEVIPCDPSPMIDGQRFANGLCLHEGGDIREVVENDLDGGYPEAIYLNLHHTNTSLTFETPSERDVATRIAAQIRAIESFVTAR